MTPGIGAGRGKKLVEYYGGIDAIFAASLTDLEAAGLPAAAAQSIALGKSLELAGEELDRLRELGATAIVPTDPRYPSRLLEIYDPPLILYVRGDAEILNEFGVAVVGTRHPTPYGLGVAERLACDLAARGLIIISGMARGVDTAAHRGTLNAHGKTVAVWGTGVNVTYPKENQKLADQIIARVARSSPSFRWDRFLRRKIFLSATGLSAACRSACWSSKPANTAEPGLPPAAPWSRGETFTRFRAT